MKIKKIVLFYISSALLALFTILTIFSPSDKENLITCWGEHFAYSKEVKAIMDLPIMQRLKDVDQSGPARYFGPILPKFSRFDHSVDVWAILKKYGASYEEQIAGLLHDSSHTVFSHVGDYIFAKKITEFAESSFQDSIHVAYLKSRKISDSLKKFGIKIKIDDLDPENKQYKRLEQPLPDMCADRIQYNIHTGILFGKISKSEAKKLIDDISFKNGKWFFTNKQSARKFAEMSLYFTQNFWGSKWNVSLNIHLANALKRALELKIITEDELFLTDSVIMNKLIKNQDLTIQLNLQQCKKPIEHIPGKRYKTEFFKPKFRGIDPLVLEGDKLVRLTEIDFILKNYYEDTRNWCKNGFYVDVLLI
ncbi:MAG: HD domain-containing protein [Holosporales bacterium]|jgi:HD superfamily phosphohydrolase|nr:HD domain-containing protein [Holosporales bacterium]